MIMKTEISTCPAPLHIQTPLIYSNSLSRLVPGAEIYLKMECCQVSGSYKIRGIGRRCQLALARGCQKLVGSSAGNAGVALARAARLIGLPCTVYVPRSTSHIVLERLTRDKANVIIHGENFKEATEKALEEVDEPRVTFVHAHDHPEIWEGHQTLIDELIFQAPCKPSAIVLSVGGGGLLCGVLQGIESHGWSDIPIISVETKGAHCFNLSIASNKRVSLDKITSIAVTLGASVVCKDLMEMRKKFKILSSVVSDAQAVYSCLQFADAERVLVEPACGATLSTVYFGILQNFQNEGLIDITTGPVIVIVCGGNGTSLDLLHTWGERFDVLNKKPKALGINTVDESTGINNEIEKKKKNLGLTANDENIAVA
ncbi:L-serine dehydratase/L-threonine deaminase-like [Lycorma delicatula]|uniref:L-serine dehydratase/L-threonine deaminase-like n=1 Tax=Lycorma delicatula TaxID=130591 RepID=UPI003F5103B3